MINALVEASEGRQRHIHYRDSKLTYFLKDSLGGNSKTRVIANISPSSHAFQETLSTLKFAKRVKLIKNKVSINEDSTGNLESLKNEIKRLKLQLAQTKALQATSLEINKKDLSEIMMEENLVDDLYSSPRPNHNNNKLPDRYEINEKIL